MLSTTKEKKGDGSAKMATRKKQCCDRWQWSLDRTIEGYALQWETIAMTVQGMEDGSCNIGLLMAAIVEGDRGNGDDDDGKGDDDGVDNSIDCR
ncbi:hypothetical protein BHE74_00021758 [Ensete ventricosum]|nr:hypothetical protein BHE74_00021758 [Ensete ventricosum]RZR79370.1 hypothetical protein BHM03_00005086 [Ensete ventricosum]